MAATFNTTLETLKGTVIGKELRSIAAANRPDFNSVYGLSCFSPMMNIIRDPFWGRNHEGYSEDPFLTGELAHSVVTGMQGQDPRCVLFLSFFLFFHQSITYIRRHIHVPIVRTLVWPLL